MSRKLFNSYLKKKTITSTLTIGVCVSVTAVALLFVFGFPQSTSAQSPDPDAYNCSVSYGSGSQKQYQLGYPPNDGYMMVSANTNTNNPNTLETFIEPTSVYAFPLPNSDWPTYTAMFVSGSSGATNWYLRPVITGSVNFGSGDFSNEQMDLADSGYPNSNHHRLQVTYPAPPENPSSGYTWTFSYTITGAMTISARPPGTPDQTKEWDITITCDAANTNSSPDASDDGNNEAQICSTNAEPIDIDVLDNDSDPDGDSLSIDSVGNPVNGSTAIVTKSGTDYVRYTPGTNTGTVTFDYTASDGNGGTNTATVTVEVTEECGEITVRVEDQSGNVVSNATFTPTYDSDLDGLGEKLPEKTGEFTYNVLVSDQPRLSEMNQSLMQNIPDGYAKTVQGFNKDVEETVGGDKEPDDFWYGSKLNINKSKLATDIASSTNASSTNGGCSEVSVQDDFSGDDLTGSAVDTDSNTESWNPDPRSASLDISSVLSSGETSGNLIAKFSSADGFTADLDCSGGGSPDLCSAGATFKKDGTTVRSVTAKGDYGSPADFAEDTSDISMNVNDSDTVNLETTGYAYIGPNTSSYAEGQIQVDDIVLEVCDT
jgi:hypothetical protein